MHARLVRVAGSEHRRRARWETKYWWFLEGCWFEKGSRGRRSSRARMLRAMRPGPQFEGVKS